MPGKKKTAAGKRLTVKQVKSGIGMPGVQKRTLRAIGLKHHQDVIEVTDTPSMRGSALAASRST